MKRKNIFFMVILWAGCFFLTGNVFGGELVTSARLGRFSPEATSSDMIYGLEFSNAIDKYLELGVSIDYFTNQHTEETSVKTIVSGAGTLIDQKQVSMETNTQYVPVLANVKLKLPLAELPVTPYATAGLGYCWLWDDYTNYIDNVEDTVTYRGMVWRVAIGGDVALGTYSSIGCEVFRNEATPSHDENTEAGLPTRNEVDMSGYGFFVQFKFRY